MDTLLVTRQALVIGRGPCARLRWKVLHILMSASSEARRAQCFDQYIIRGDTASLPPVLGDLAGVFIGGGSI